MATTISTRFPSSPVPSCRLDGIRLHTSEPGGKARVVLTRTSPQLGFVDLMDVELYAFENQIYLANVGRLIEEDMRLEEQNLVSYGLFLDGSETAAVEWQVVYCERVSPVADLSTIFFTAFPSQRIGPNSPLALASLPMEGCVGMIAAYRRSSDGKVLPYAWSSCKSLDSGFLTWSTGAIQAAIREDTDDERARLLRFTLTLGDRSKTWHVVPYAPTLQLSFRNCFNCPDYIDLRGKIREKTKSEAAEAVCRGAYRQYDRRTERTFEFESASLVQDEAFGIDQLFTSRDIRLLHPISGEWRQIHITEGTCEPSNDDTENWSVKFTFRFAEQRNDTAHLFLHAYNTLTGVFTEEFTPPYS